MSFDYSTLITDRTRSDSDTLKTLLSKPMAEWTAEERTAFNGAVMRGSYDYTDLNRVDACLEDLVARLGRVGCNVPGYERLKIERAVTPSSRLPEGYAEVQYIQSTGTQYVDTGVRQNQNSRVVVDFQLVSAPADSYAWIFEGRDTGPKNRHSVYATKSNGNWHSGYGSASKNTNISYDLAVRITVDFNKNVLKIGNTAITFAQEVFQSSTSTVLFGCNTGGTIGYYAQAKLFGCRFFDGDTLLRDFIPCKNAGGAVGLYDLIGQKFYGNAGTGSFTAGPVVTWDAPEEPTETLDPYTWYESDVPVPSQMARYRANVAAVRAVLRLPEGTPETPETMRRLTTTEANSIEAILLALNLILNKIHTAVRHCGVTVCGSKGVRA